MCIEIALGVRLGLTPNQYFHNEITTASYNFCTSFGQEAVTEDVVNPLRVAALLGSSSKKQGL